MNSSKNRPNAFVPEKIIPLKGAGQSGWRSVSLPIAQQEIRQILSEIDGSGAAGARQPMQEHSQADSEGPDSAHGEEAEHLTSEQGQQDLENLRKNAYDEGVRDGLKMADEDFGASARALLMACEQISTLRETILHNSMEEMQNLVLAIAEKIIRHSVTVQNDTIIATVEEAIRQAVKTDELTIEVNPADLAVIKSRSRDLIDSLSGLENIVIQTNPEIERGGCRIDSSTSTVDATLASQLQIIKQAIEEG